MSKKKVAILGSGNIGTDLLVKITEHSEALEVGMVVGIDPDSDGLARARAMGVATTHRGVEGLLESDVIDEIVLALDATSARAHAHHAEVLGARNIPIVDLTPAAIGPYVVPVVNLEEHRGAANVNMVTCGGQATIPIVHAADRVARVRYAEIVASIASRSAGPGTRANIDEFTETTARGLEVVGGAERGKAIIILNPAEPPLVMRDTVHMVCEGATQAELDASIREVVAQVAAYVPGYRLAQPPVFEDLSDHPLRSPELDGPLGGLKVSVFLEVEGAGDYLPRYAGNLDIMTSAAARMAEVMTR